MKKEEIKIPHTYRFNPIVRFSVLLLAIFAFSYAVYVLMVKISPASSTLHKIIPYAIIFLSINVVIKNLFNLNSIKITSEFIRFSYIAKKNKTISWNSVKSLELLKNKLKTIKLVYQDFEKTKAFYFGSDFTHIVVILKTIRELNPKIKFDEVLQKVIDTK